MDGMRVVRRGPAGLGWTVAEGEAAGPSHTSETKALAVERARADLRGLPGGGRLRVYRADGGLEYERFVAADSGVGVLRGALAGGPPTPQEVHRQIKAEGKKVDKGLDGLDTLLGFVAYLGIPVTSATISPEVQKALDGGWMAVFFATLTWTLGCTGAMIVLERSGLLGYPLLFAVTACFLVALGVANALGRGVLELDLTSTSTAPGPLRPIGMFVQAALLTYGWLGTLVGTAIGAWLGHRLARLAPERFAV